MKPALPRFRSCDGDITAEENDHHTVVGNGCGSASGNGTDGLVTTAVGIAAWSGLPPRVARMLEYYRLQSIHQHEAYVQEVQTGTAPPTTEQICLSKRPWENTKTVRKVESGRHRRRTDGTSSSSGATKAQIRTSPTGKNQRSLPQDGRHDSNTATPKRHESIENCVSADGASSHSGGGKMSQERESSLLDDPALEETRASVHEHSAVRVPSKGSSGKVTFATPSIKRSSFAEEASRVEKALRDKLSKPPPGGAGAAIAAARFKSNELGEKRSFPCAPEVAAGLHNSFEQSSCCDDFAHGSASGTPAVNVADLPIASLHRKSLSPSDASRPTSLTHSRSSFASRVAGLDLPAQHRRSFVHEIEVHPAEAISILKNPLEVANEATASANSCSVSSDTIAELVSLRRHSGIPSSGVVGSSSRRLTNTVISPRLSFVVVPPSPRTSIADVPASPRTSVVQNAALAAAAVSAAASPPTNTEADEVDASHDTSDESFRRTSKSPPQHSGRAVVAPTPRRSRSSRRSRHGSGVGGTLALSKPIRAPPMLPSPHTLMLRRRLQGTPQTAQDGQVADGSSASDDETPESRMRPSRKAVATAFEVCEWSSQLDGGRHAATNLATGARTKCWESTGMAPQWVVLELPQELEVSGIRLRLRGEKGDPKDLHISRSFTMKGPWVDVKRCFLDCEGQQHREFPLHRIGFEGGSPSRFWKLTVNETWCPGPVCLLAPLVVLVEPPPPEGSLARGPSLTTMFCESVNISEEEREMRMLARNHQIPLDYAEYLRGELAKYDSSGVGSLSFENFAQVVRAMISEENPPHVERAEDISDRRLQKLWREVDCDGSGRVELEEFMIWLHAMFRRNMNADSQMSVHSNRPADTVSERLYASFGVNRLKNQTGYVM
eukprot:TRINITY_DN48531_c0_g1_i1.p1 TRINITY_DN48531_c0_g1~~TRINITY_DN48531_c0_g1_i1.p1  ORF type:complete len:1023 (-),score=145.43 TRINITY_DN48531_c0_g1_i1:354-3035(-)